MYYNIKRILSGTTLTLLVASLSISDVRAQGTVSLASDVEQNDGFLDFDSGIPNEVSLFEEETTASSGLIQPTEKISAEKVTLTEKKDETPQNLFGSLEPSSTDVVKAKETAETDLGSVPQLPAGNAFGEVLLSQTDERLFSQMSDLEKQTALLTLELRREKIKNEIEAIRMQRQKSIQDEEDAKERKRREKLNWEAEQQKKLLAEQAKLKENEIKLEKLRQEKVLKAYKSHMLLENKKWIEALSTAYKKTQAVEKERDDYINDFKNKMTQLSTLSKKISSEATTAKENYAKEIESLQTQISILNAKIKAMSTLQGDGIQNPFSTPGFGTSDNPNLKLSDEYIILEIRGKGDNMIAKISNKSGAEAFLIQKGTLLKSGHIIEEIAPTFIRADRAGAKDYIYFSAGGILDKEPDAELKMKSLVPLGSESVMKPSQKEDDKFVPDSFMKGMFVR
ncbi:MAG: hypothetical protein PHE89_02260 [Alphaproteobacteria bacterium]|nr:hypothetical protein [Alphaproteobacteria bacterium]